jgi:predicted PurR-regulated permease PerM
VREVNNMNKAQVVIITLLVALIAFVAVGVNAYQSQQTQINQLKHQVAVVKSSNTLGGEVATLERDMAQVGQYEKQATAAIKSNSRGISNLSTQITGISSEESNDESTLSCLNGEFQSLQQFASDDGGLGSGGEINGFGTCY